MLESNSSWRAPDLKQLGRPGGCSPPPLLPRIPIPTAWESSQTLSPFFCQPRPLLPAGAHGRSCRSSEEASPAGTGHITRAGCVWGGTRLVTPLAPADFGRACSVGAEAPRSCQQLRGRRAGSFFLRRAGQLVGAAPDGGWQAAASAARGWGQPRRRPWPGKVWGARRAAGDGRQGGKPRRRGFPCHCVMCLLCVCF